MPVISMAVCSGTPGRTRWRTAVRRKSWGTRSTCPYTLYATPYNSSQLDAPCCGTRGRWSLPCVDSQAFVSIRGASFFIFSSSRPPAGRTQPSGLAGATAFSQLPTARASPYNRQTSSELSDTRAARRGPSRTLPTQESLPGVVLLEYVNLRLAEDFSCSIPRLKIRFKAESSRFTEALESSFEPASGTSKRLPVLSSAPVGRRKTS